MRRWLARLAADFKREYHARLAEHDPVPVAVQGVQQAVQSSVDMIVWRARGCALNSQEGSHDVFDTDCRLCWILTHCPDHSDFDAECANCRTFKDPDVRGTVSHYHADPAKQAAESELGQGREVWRT